VDRAITEFGKFDILVNNATMQRTHENINEMSAEEWDQLPNQSIRGSIGHWANG
jgi:NADP-dependent 3-hydroxy acid dehydrogenase YdfG